MNIIIDKQTIWIQVGLAGLLLLSSIIGYILKLFAKSESAKATVENLNVRIRAWWVMYIIGTIAMFTTDLGSVILFAFTSFWALREFITMTPTSHSDHRTLFWIFFLITPFQYYLVAIRWYGMFTIMIPVYAFLFIPIRSVIEGNAERFLERTAKIQWGLMICVYCISHVPALLMLKLDNYEGQNAKLLFFLVFVDQISNVLQYVWGKLFGKNKIAPNISPNKTWEGFIGGISCATLIGTSLWCITPFKPWQAAVMSLMITLLGFAGGLVMSAIKRDRGVKDYGILIEGHGGMLDRIDSLCFAAPIFFHVTGFYF